MRQTVLQAYQAVERATSPLRENDARTLMEGAMKLKRCQDLWESDERVHLLETALKYNQRIWSMFQADLAVPDHPMPLDLRISLLRLGMFVDKQIFRTLAAPSPDKLEPIIEVNMGIARGLRGDARTETGAPE